MQVDRSEGTGPTVDTCDGVCGSPLSIGNPCGNAPGMNNAGHLRLESLADNVQQGTGIRHGTAESGMPCLNSSTLGHRDVSLSPFDQN